LDHVKCNNEIKKLPLMGVILPVKSGINNAVYKTLPCKEVDSRTINFFAGLFIFSVLIEVITGILFIKVSSLIKGILCSSLT